MKQPSNPSDGNEIHQCRHRKKLGSHRTSELARRLHLLEMERHPSFAPNSRHRLTGFYVGLKSPVSRSTLLVSTKPLSAPVLAPGLFPVLRNDSGVSGSHPNTNTQQHTPH